MLTRSEVTIHQVLKQLSGAASYVTTIEEP